MKKKDGNFIYTSILSSERDDLEKQNSNPICTKMWKCIEFTIPVENMSEKTPEEPLPSGCSEMRELRNETYFLVTIPFVFWLLKMCICYILIKISKCVQRNEICPAQVKRSGCVTWRTGSLRHTLSYGTCIPPTSSSLFFSQRWHLAVEADPPLPGSSVLDLATLRHCPQVAGVV